MRWRNGNAAAVGAGVTLRNPPVAVVWIGLKINTNAPILAERSMLVQSLLPDLCHRSDVVVPRPKRKSILPPAFTVEVKVKRITVCCYRHRSNVDGIDQRLRRLSDPHEQDGAIGASNDRCSGSDLGMNRCR